MACAMLSLARQEHEAARRISPAGGSGTGATLRRKRVGHLHAGCRRRRRCWPRSRSAPRWAKVLQDLERLAHDRVRLAPLDVHDETDAAGVVLVARIVQARRRGRTRMASGDPLSSNIRLAPEKPLGDRPAERALLSFSCKQK